MAEKSVTSKRLEQLAEIDSGELCRKTISELFGISGDAVYSRFRRRNRSFYKKVDIAKVLRELRPEIDRWYDATAASKETGIDSKVMQNWSRYPCVRKRIDVRNSGGRVYFNPSWVNKTKIKIQRVGGWDNLISAPEASQMLDIEQHDLSRFNLQPLQFTGRRSKRYFQRDKVLKLKKKIEKVGGWDNLISTNQLAGILKISRHRVKWLGLSSFQFRGKKSKHYFRKERVLKLYGRIKIAESLYSSRKVASLLDWSDSEVLKVIKPAMHHPLTKEPRYLPSVVIKHFDSLYSKATPLNDILGYCQSHIYGNGDVKGIVKKLVYSGHIPRAGKDRKQNIYLTQDSENMVLSIYENHKKMAKKKVELLTIAEASSKMTISEKQLRHLVDYYGVAEPLSEYFPSTCLQYSRNGERLEVPFVTYVPKSRLYFLASPIVDSLDKRIRTLQTELAKEGKKLKDTPWRSRLMGVKSH